jgi:predicted DNA repair protein MutK
LIKQYKIYAVPKTIIMASGFFVLLDDIAAIMDDVAAMSKIATKKTAGILGDDLAVNAEKASGFISSREIPVLWAIAKGSFLNKLIILPIAFLLSAFSPLAIIIILVLGGLYLAYEGAEKIYEYFFPHEHSKPEISMQPLTEAEILTLEKEKIKSAIVTDFILSVEIVIIALGTVIGKPITSQIMVVSIVAIIATVGVYGIVALIVRMDELGFKLIGLSTKERSLSKTIGNILVQALPKVIKSLAVIGTIALILVAGGIFVHNIDFLHHVLPQLPSILKEFSIGLIIGGIVLGIVNLFKKMIRKK